MRARPLRPDRANRMEPSGRADDVTPLFVWLGAIGALFVAGMAGDRLGPVLQSAPVVALASTYAAQALLSVGLVALALAIVWSLRLIAGPFDLSLHAGRQRWDLRGGVVGFGLWALCLLIEVAVARLWW